MWLGATIEDDSFGRRLLEAGVKKDLIAEWMQNAMVNTPDGMWGGVGWGVGWCGVVGWGVVWGGVV